jgi:uncharacterized membrane protein YczE
MKSYRSRFIKLIAGLFLYAVGIVLTLKANIGYAPWDVFHAGLSKTIGISIGTASIIVGLAILIIAVILGEKLGVGSVVNMVLIGLFINWILAVDLIPLANGLITGIIMLFAGIFVISLASYFYMGSSFGAGPRDSLMVGLRRKTGMPIGFCRSLLEFLAALIGWRMGGLLGFGTILAACLSGFCIQITFKALKFDTTALKHETFADTYRNIRKGQKTSATKSSNRI